MPVGLNLAERTNVSRRGKLAADEASIQCYILLPCFSTVKENLRQFQYCVGPYALIMMTLLPTYNSRPLYAIMHACPSCHKLTRTLSTTPRTLEYVV